MGGDLGTCAVCYYNWARWCRERYLDKQLTIDQERRQRSPTRKLLSFSHDVVRTTSCSVWSLSHSRSFFSFPITVQRLIIAPHTVIQEHIRFDKLSQCSWYGDPGTKKNRYPQRRSLSVCRGAVPEHGGLQKPPARVSGGLPPPRPPAVPGGFQPPRPPGGGPAAPRAPLHTERLCLSGSPFFLVPRSW